MSTEAKVLQGDFCEQGGTGIVGFTYDDAYEVVRRTRKPILPAPENRSRRATVAGPSIAAERFNFDVIRELMTAGDTEG